MAVSTSDARGRTGVNRHQRSNDIHVALNADRPANRALHPTSGAVSACGSTCYRCRLMKLPWAVKPTLTRAATWLAQLVA